MEDIRIREKLRHMRTVRKLTLEELSARSGVAVGTIHDLEAGRVSDPRLSTLLKLTEALRVNLEYFLNPMARTPLEVAEHIPEDLRQYIIQAESMPYLELAQKADIMGLPPEAVESLLRALYDSMRRSRER